MKYDLSNLEELVSRLNPKSNGLCHTHQELEALLSAIQSEVCAVKQGIIEAGVSQLNTSELSIVIQHQQRSMIVMLDALGDSITSTQQLITKGKNERSPHLTGVQKASILVLVNYLHFLERRYKTLLDQQLLVPKMYKELLIRRVQLKFNDIILDNSKVSSLIVMALAPIQYLIDNPGYPLTYKGLFFRQELFQKMAEALRFKDVVIVENEMIKALISVNFNSMSFVGYYISKVQNELDQHAALTEKMERLYWHFKILNQTNSIKGSFLYQNQPSIKETLSKWLLEEICFLEKKVELQGMCVNLQGDDTESKIKMITEFSVPQIACFVKLMVKSGGITNENKEDILRFFSSYFLSKKAGAFTYGSFRSKYCLFRTN